MEEDGLQVIKSEKNNNALAMLGLMPGVRKEVIRNLNYRNYVSGPDTDRDVPGQVIWVFGAFYEGTEFYVKLVLSGEAKCLSFHFPEYKMIYPFV